MAVFLRGSSYYIKIRRGGRQVLRLLDTSDKSEAIAKAKELIRALESPIDTAFDTTSHDGRDARAAGPLGSYFDRFRVV